jgi:hypothetical protein
LGARSIDRARLIRLALEVQGVAPKTRTASSEADAKELRMMMRNGLGPLVVAALFMACGGPLKYDAISSPRAPGADASITADVREDQHQTELRLEIDNLPPAERVDADSQHYVAWYRRDAKETWTRIAGLDYEADSREAILQTAVPETQFDLWVTAEKELDVVSPSPNVVFTQRVGS